MDWKSLIEQDEKQRIKAREIVDEKKDDEFKNVNE